MMMNKPTKSEFSFRRFLILLGMVLGGIYVFLFHLPRLTGFILFMVIGVFVLSTSVAALRKGYLRINARTRFVTYMRAENPVAFWFYVFFFIVLGVLICCFAFCFLPSKFNVFRNFLQI